MALSDWINRTEIQVVHCTPSVFQMIRANISLKDYQKLQYVFLAGEKYCQNMWKSGFLCLERGLA